MKCLAKKIDIAIEAAGYRVAAFSAADIREGGA
jgi:hypothetical protein